MLKSRGKLRVTLANTSSTVRLPPSFGRTTGISATTGSTAGCVLAGNGAGGRIGSRIWAVSGIGLRVAHPNVSTGNPVKSVTNW